MAKQGKIKVLFTIPNFDTAGSGKALLKIAESLNPECFEPHIACMHNKGVFFKIVEQSGIPIHIIPYTIRMKPYYKGVLHCYKISRLFKKINPDIIHSFHYAPDYSEALAARLAGIPWVYTKKNMNWGGSSGNGWKLRSFLAKAIILQNTDMKAQFFPESNKTFLIPRGVDISEFKPAAAKPSLLKKWGLTENNPVLMCVANLVPVKGVHILIDAFKNVISHYPEWKLVIVGKDTSEYSHELKQKTKKEGLLEKVIFTGSQTNIAEYLNLACVFALPTLNEGRKEGSPVALLEAMACGCCVMGSDVPGIRDQLAAFPDLLVEAGSIEAWTRALKKMLGNSPQELDQLGNELREHIVNHFTLGKEVHKSEVLYKKITGK